MRNVLKNMKGVKFHITSYRGLGAAAIQNGRSGRPKIQLSSKVAKFAGKIGIDLPFIFCMPDYPCAILSF